MTETKTIAAMTDRQRSTLVARLNGEAVTDPFAERFGSVSTLSWAAR
jgi:hypothetical protein